LFLVEIRYMSEHTSEYTASSIKILPAPEAIERFAWLKAEELAARTGKPIDWIKRGLQACEQASVAHSYFISRYLDGNKDVPRNRDVESAMADILKSLRPSSRELTPRKGQNDRP
jgi:hypothetical protein